MRLRYAGREQDTPSMGGATRARPAVVAVLLSVTMIVAAVWVAARSGGEDGSVTGKVTVGGRALASGTITFWPDDGGPPAGGPIGADGTYRLTTYEEGDGAVPGKHKVTVQAEQVTEAASASKSINDEMKSLYAATADPPVQVRQLVPARYACGNRPISPPRSGTTRIPLISICSSTTNSYFSKEGGTMQRSMMVLICGEVLLSAASAHGESAYAAAVKADGPVAYWRLNEAAGATQFQAEAGFGNVPLDAHDGTDSRGGAVNDSGPGAGVSGVPFSDEPDNKAVFLPNTGPYPYFPCRFRDDLRTDSPIDLSGTGDWTLEMWIRHADADASGYPSGASSTSEDLMGNEDLGVNTDAILIEIDGSGDPGFLPNKFRMRTRYDANDLNIVTDSSGRPFRRRRASIGATGTTSSSPPRPTWMAWGASTSTASWWRRISGTAP